MKNFSVDDLLDSLQQMIDLIRNNIPNTDERCDAWEKRLYEWHDAYLEIMARETEKLRETGEESIVIGGDDAQTVLSVEKLRSDITNFGNPYFLPDDTDSE